MISSVCQRWTRRRCTWRPAGEPFVPSRFEVAPIAGDTIVRAFVREHHYLRTLPPVRRRFGLYTVGTHVRGAAPSLLGGELVGVAVFSQPLQDAVLKPFPAREAMDLGRLVLLDAVPGNAESWLVARCLDALRREGLAGVVSFSDPAPRWTTDGVRTTPGHVGGVYQAVNAVYLGQRDPGTLLLLPDATTIHARSLSKIRAKDSRWRSAIKPLIEAGAPTPADTSTAGLRAWVSALILGALTPHIPDFIRPMVHPGNFKYALPLTRAGRKLAGESLPYPRVTRPVMDVCSPVEARAAA